MGVEGTPGLAPYVPRLVAEWGLDEPGTSWRALDATCCFVDISGFTALSERLARRGRIGAEELTEVLNHVFSRMLEVAYAKGGSLLKFGGDALLLSFTGEDHPVLAAQAAVAMRAALREARTLPTSVGRLNLRMSVGMHTGTFHFFRVGRSHHELIVTGPAASETTRMEQIADAGEIVVSAACAERLPPVAVGAAKEAGRLLRWRQVHEDGPGPTPMRPVPEGAVEETIPVALRVRLADARNEPEHRSACVAFVKFRGVDALLGADGPAATADALDQLITAVQEAADGERVTFLATDIDADGGKVILTTGVPAAQDDDEGRILRAARRIVGTELALPVRVGVNSGHVFAGAIGSSFRRTFTVMGDTVNLAARIMAAAAPGEVLATAGVLDRAATQFASEALEPFMVKGKAEPVQAYRVGESLGPKTAGTGSLPFRGRDKELTELLHAVQSAAEGTGGVALVEAERGAGKSRLLGELIDVLHPGIQVLCLRGAANGAAVPYLPIRPVLREALGISDGDRRQAGVQLRAALAPLGDEVAPYAPFLAPVVDAELPPTQESEAVAEEFVRDRVAELVLEVLDATVASPLLLVAEDAHWFDDATTSICQRLARAAATRPWLLCVARRPGPGGFEPPAPGPHLRLGPLGADAATELVELATDAAPIRPSERDGLVARAGGNPLFLEELLRIVRDTDVEALPESLDAVAMRDIDALPPVPRRALRVASVLGGTFERATLEELLAADGIEVDAGLFASLSGQLLSEGEHCRFRHAVLQEAAYQSLPFRARLVLHRQAAEAIERTSPELERGDVAAMLSFHFLAAQDWERTWHHARAAARFARAAHAPGDSAVHLGRAVTAGRKLGGGAAADMSGLFMDLGSTLELLGEYERADDAYRRAALAAAHEPLAGFEVAEHRAYLRTEFLGRPAAAVRQLRAALARLDAGGGAGPDVERLRAKLLARQSSARMRQGHLAEAIECSERAEVAAERAGDKASLAHALSTRNVCLLLLGRLEEADFHRVLDLYEELEDHVQIAVTLSNMGGKAFFTCRWDEAAEYVARSAEASQLAGDLAAAAVGHVNLAELRVNQGRIDDALPLLASARRVGESFGYRVLMATAAMQLGRARAFAGELDDGLGLLRGAVTTFDEIGSPNDSVDARARLAEVLAAAGLVAEARAVLEEARRLGHGDEDSPAALLLGRVALTLDAVTGDVDAVAAGLGSFVERARAAGAAYDLLVVLELAARLGGRAGDGVDRDEIARLRRDLGIVTLPELPVLPGVAPSGRAAGRLIPSRRRHPLRP